MTLIVDFNMTREDGLVPALLTISDVEVLQVGSKVTTIDGEGTECKAEVISIEETPRGQVALVRPVGGSWRYDSDHTLSSDDLLTR